MNKKLSTLIVVVVLLSACGGGVSDSGNGNPGDSSDSSLTDLSGLDSAFTKPPQDANGWSILTPSEDSRLIYVSNGGNDSTAQVYTPASAEVGSDPFNPSGAIQSYATLSAALAQTRAGYPDYVLLKRGDTWEQSATFFLKRGRSATERSVLGYYGSAAGRPTITHHGVNLSRASNSALIGIRFYASQRDPASSDFVGFASVSGDLAFQALGGTGSDSFTGGLLIEDCWFDWFLESYLQKYTGPALTDIIIRRNLFTNSYSVGGHSQGLYTDGTSILLEENIFDHNGWYKQGDPAQFSDPAEGKATMFNHNTYFCGARDTIFRNNLFLRASSIGNKFTSNTSSGTNVVNAWNILIDNNLYVEGEIGISLGGNDDQNNGPRWRNVDVTNNVMMHIGRTQPTFRTLGWGLDVNDWDSGVVSGNIFTSWGSAPTLLNNYAIHTGGDTNDVTYTGNIVYNIPSGGALVQFLDGSINQRTHFTGNDISTDYTGILLSYSLTSNSGFGNNSFFSARPQSQWFQVSGTTASLDAYRTAAGDTTSMAGKRNYVDPTRTIETYLSSLGYAPDMDSFVALLCQQSKFNWIPALQASAINNYIRAGFVTH